MNLDEMLDRLMVLPEDEKKKIIAEALTASQGLRWIPSPGPQTEAYFSKADILLYGGEPGGGKTSLLLGLAFNNHRRSLIMRKQYTDLGAIVEEAVKFHGSRKGYNGSPPPSLRINKDKFIEFGAAARVGDEEHWQGNPHDLICVGVGTPVLMADGSYKGVERLHVGDMVQTLEGPRRIERTFPPQYKEAIRITTPYGSQIQSKTHALLAPEGWVSHGMCDGFHPSSISSPTVYQIFYKVGRVFSALFAKALRPLSALGWGRLHKVLTALSFQSPHLQIPHGKETYVYVSTPNQGNADATSCGLRPIFQPQPLSNGLQERRAQFAGLGGQCCAQDYVSAYDDCDVPQRSLLANFRARCSNGFRRYGERIHDLLTRIRSSAGGLLYLHRPSDAVRPNPTDSPDGGVARIPRYSPHRLVYAHPYKGGKRQANESVFHSSYTISNVGVQELYDIQVQDVCHYITHGGFVNKNCFDEGTQFAERQIRFLMGWLRCADDPKQRTRVVIATNPPLSSEGAWVVQMFAPWLDPRHHNPAKIGELRWFITDEHGKDTEVDGPEPYALENGKTVSPLSRTFIPASVSDNPYLANTDYQKQLDAMVEPFRSILMGGFLASFRDADNQCIPTAWVRDAQKRWTPRPKLGIPMCAIGVDVAQGGADNTILAPRYDDWFAPLIEKPGRETPLGRDVAGMIVSNRKDNAVIVLDMGGGYGGATYECLMENEIPVIAYKGATAVESRTKDRQLKFTNKRAEAYWRLREALDPSQEGGATMALPDDPVLMADLTAPTFEITKQGVKLETKEDLVKRLGRSPDKGDAVVMSWSSGPKFMSDGGEWISRRDTLIRGAQTNKVVMGRRK